VGRSGMALSCSCFRPRNSQELREMSREMSYLVYRKRHGMNMEPFDHCNLGTGTNTGRKYPFDSPCLTNKHWKDQYLLQCTHIAIPRFKYSSLIGITLSLPLNKRDLHQVPLFTLGDRNSHDKQLPSKARQTEDVNSHTTLSLTLCRRYHPVHLSLLHIHAPQHTLSISISHITKSLLTAIQTPA